MGKVKDHQQNRDRKTKMNPSIFTALSVPKTMVYITMVTRDNLVLT